MLASSLIIIASKLYFSYFNGLVYLILDLLLLNTLCAFFVLTYIFELDTLGHCHTCYSDFCMTWVSSTGLMFLVTTWYSD